MRQIDLGKLTQICFSQNTQLGTCDFAGKKKKDKDMGRLTNVVAEKSDCNLTYINDQCTLENEGKYRTLKIN